MKKKLALLVILFSVFYAKTNAQCGPCPTKFFLTDSISCLTEELSKNCPGGGTNFVNCVVLNACKNSRQVYTLTPFGTDAFGAPCVYPAFQYNSPTITGGTIVSYGGNKITIQWGSANSGSILIPFSSPPGGSAPCRDTIRLSFNLLNNPVASFVASPQPACFNSPTNISFNSGASVGAVSYFWKFGDGFTSTLPNPVHAYTSPGNYTVCLVVTNTSPADTSQGQRANCPSCIDSICKNVVIDNLPGPSIECVATVCALDTARYCTTASGCSGYAWTVTGGTIISGLNTSCISVLWGSGNPQGTVTLVATGCSTAYCPQGTTVNVPIIPAATAISGSITVCINTTTAYSLPSWPGTTYGWVLPIAAGTIVGFNTNTNQINVKWTAIGTYVLTCNYFDTALNCGGVGTITVRVLPVLKITGNASICQTQSSTLQSLYNAPNTNVNCNWTISPAGATVTGGNGTPFATINWAIPGVYTVTAIPVTAGIVCGNASYTVTVFPSPVISAITGADSICPNKTYVYAATSNASGIFFWNVTNGMAVNLGANNDSVQVTWGGAGPYIISVQQFSYANNCASNVFNKNVFRYPTPALTGPVGVCADNVVSYTITNILNGSFNWFVTPISFGTIISGQGTNSISIRWHGNNSPGSSNIVYLHYGICGSDSIAVTINEPTLASITATGVLCSGGVTLTTGATGTFTWSVPGGVPPPGNVSSIAGLTIPGGYFVVIQNFNGSGCSASASYTIPPVGVPIASISATDRLEYCLPSLPNMSLVAVTGPGYTYQWYKNGVAIPAATAATLAVNSGAPCNITGAGVYSFYCVVSLGGCSATSIVIEIKVFAVCPGPPSGGMGGAGCYNGTIKIINITGCNPFTITIAPVSPPTAYIIPGTTEIYHFIGGTWTYSNTTKTFTTIGYQPIRIYAIVKNNDSTVCYVYVDTTVLVRAAPAFNYYNNCGVVSLNDLSTVVSPAIINTYSWTVGTNPGNLPTLNGTFNNPAIPSPVLTFTASGSYIISLTITSGPCTITVRDTLPIAIPDANFIANISCVGTPVPFLNPPSAVDFWDFGDAATSYTSPTFHAWGTPGIFNITHIITNGAGCRDTVVKPIFIIPASTCTIAYGGPTIFCLGDSLMLNGCLGYTSYQWYNNGAAIGAPLGIQPFYIAKQTGNYSFIGVDVNGCKVVSDTVSLSVTQAPSTAFTASANRCANSNFSLGVPNCAGCSYVWQVDNLPDPTLTNQLSYTIGTPPLTVGTHSIKVTVTNPAGCSRTDSVTVTLFANPLVNIAVVGSPAMLCSNNLYTLVAATSAASPSWVWNYNNIGINLSATNTLMASSAGSYTVYVTDGVTGCRTSAVKVIKPSPELNLFPIGCDTLCDTSHVFLPIGSISGNVSNYLVNWYNNAPPYIPVIGTGVSFNLNVLPPGNHNLSVIVTNLLNGCADTSNVYSVYTRNCNVLLPVKELVLSARRLGAYALLNWSTNEEINNDYFAVESSLDGIHFSYVNRVNSRGNSNTKQYYSFNGLLTVYNSIVFYRIRAVDKNGLYSYSNTVQLRPSKAGTESILVLPNIVTGSATITVQSNSSIITSLVVFAADGKQMQKTTIRLTKGINTLPIDTGNFAGGLYYISIATGENVLTATVIKH